MQEALARQEQATKHAEGRCLAAEQEARQQSARAGELHVRCLSAEERSAALYGEALDLQGALAQAQAEVARLRDEGVTLQDRGAVHGALADVLRGCELLALLRACVFCSISPVPSCRTRGAA